MSWNRSTPPTWLWPKPKWQSLHGKVTAPNNDRALFCYKLYCGDISNKVLSKRETQAVWCQCPHRNRWAALLPHTHTLGAYGVPSDRRGWHLINTYQVLAHDAVILLDQSQSQWLSNEEKEQLLLLHIILKRHTASGILRNWNRECQI